MFSSLRSRPNYPTAQSASNMFQVKQTNKRTSERRLEKHSDQSMFRRARYMILSTLAHAYRKFKQKNGHPIRPCREPSCDVPYFMKWLMFHAAISPSIATLQRQIWSFIYHLASLAVHLVPIPGGNSPIETFCRWISLVIITYRNTNLSMLADWIKLK